MPFNRRPNSIQHKHRFIFWMGLCFLFSCKAESTQFIERPKNSSIQYAKGFDIQEEEGFTYLYLFRYYQTSTDTLVYLLYDQKTQVLPTGNFQAQIPIPIRKGISLSSPYSAMIEVLGGIETLIAIPHAAYIYSPAILSRIKAGKVKELGPEAGVNVESVLNLEADLLMYSAFPGAISRNIEQLETLGVPCLPLAEWQENTLLGRAEWIKVIGCLLDKKEEADSLFNHAREVYEELKIKTSKVRYRPLILSSLPFKGIWSVPGGGSYLAHAFEDAGGEYYWKDEKQSTSLPLSFEAVYPVGLKAEIWVGPGVARSYKSLLAQDDRFLDFLSFKQKKVYHFYRKSNQQGGNDYWESALINPHVVLGDLVKIFHPELLPKHEMVYFEQLED